jgi:mono/diheme cytochrome c family protein
MARTGIPHRHKALFIGIGAVALMLIGGVAAAVILLSGAYSTSATKQHFRITYRILELGLEYSVNAAASDLPIPRVDEKTALLIGNACYRANCVQCHGAPGVARENLGRGQLPSASSLSQSAREWPAQNLFFVTKKGIRMSGMPAWEFRISDEGIWSTVVFMKRMAFMTREEYAQFDAANPNTDCPRPVEADPYTEELAKTTLRQYACDNCHQMDGVVGPKTFVGPSLQRWPERKYIGGILPNTRENLVRWIRDPQAVSPHPLMPNLEVTEAHAEHMARYLLTEQ